MNKVNQLFLLARGSSVVSLLLSYEGKELDLSWLRHCQGFDHLYSSSEGENLAEFSFYDLMLQHPKRVMSEAQAMFFYVPLMEYTSWRLGRCQGSEHAHRMAQAAVMIRSSPAWQRCRGTDHFYVGRHARKST